MSNKNAVFVLDSERQPCNPVHPDVARKLLSSNKAAVFRQYPFTIILKEVQSDNLKPLRIKIDPGARFTGLALVSDKNIVWAAEIEHRGFAIRDSLTSRRQVQYAEVAVNVRPDIVSQDFSIAVVRMVGCHLVSCLVF
jgi:RRXRR protein